MAPTKKSKKLLSTVKKRLKKHYDILKVLRDGNTPLRKGILREADKDLITTLSECALNVLHKNQPVSAHCKRKLAVYKRELRRLASQNHKVGWKRKRKMLVQRGGFLGVLLSSLLSGLIAKMLSS